jgi:hypothetical protein
LDQFKEIYSFVLLCLGPCGVVYSIISLFRTRAFLLQSVEVNGEVIRLVHSTDRAGATSYESYAPVFSFKVAGGRTYTVTSKISSSPADFSVGDPVRVRYDPANPEDARIHTFFQTWGGAITFGVIGIGFFAFGCYMLGSLHWTGN